MVASANGGDLYSFHTTMNHDDGPQSSEEGSGMHSPVLYGAAPGDSSFRYQHDPLDVQPAPAILTTSPYHDYSLAAQQNQIVLDGGRHLPYSNTHYLPHPSPPGHPPRGHLGLDIHNDPRLPSPAQASGSSVDWYGNIPERRLHGGQPQEHSYPRPGGTSVAISMNPDHRPQVVAPPEHTEHSAPPPSATSTTERRKETSNVVIACRQCRSRKIRCDSTRPGCNNCARRNNQCEYDAVPKRRGPDKRPGTRQRSCKKRPPPDGTNPAPPKRKKTSSDRAQEPRESSQPRAKDNLNMAQPSSRSPPTIPRASDRMAPQGYPYAHHPNASPTTDLRVTTGHPDLLAVKVEQSPTYRRELGYDQGSYPKSSFPRQLDVNSFPSLGAVPRNINLQPLNGVLAEQLNQNWARLLKANPVQVIVSEVAFVVEGTGHYLSFINVDFLEKQLWQDQYRSIHPGFIWAALALANLMRSSSVGRGQQGLQIALALFHEAKTALDIAWADATYAYAALIIALFESSAQPNYTHDRALTALVELDDYIHQMQLTLSDHHHPDVTRYEGCPVIFYPSDRENLDPRKPCPCIMASPVDLYNGANVSRSYTPRWDPSWTAEQIKAEEIRRLCWSALSLISAFLAQAATDNRRMPQFHLSNPRSYELLFPGEVNDALEPAFNHSDGLTTKESVWALYCRSMLLWNFCNRFRHLHSTEDEGISDELAEALSEAQTIDESLDMHKCNLDTLLIYTTREYTHNIRVVVTQGMRVLQGLDRGGRPGLFFKRKQAEEWIHHQEKLVRQVLNTLNNLGSPDGVQLTERPFRVQWFIHQLNTCIQLWEYERTLDEALDLGKRLMQIVDTMNSLWDCQENRAEASHLRSRLIEACRVTGVEGPFSPTRQSGRL
ncbi:hypothetical protein DFP72DRAFT_204488 [Ephemerocybe angulata]|uniref:Zn(2)-C6 fungal-type domain-containing protein n=1 Tax=Ephemerocybe angulata TaxID=980116 RepID=A0A8H6MEE5_9AGAR|nr:hypothetical protein DFP72DRAFT_204488 [Tulosesus angulatus]